MASNGTVLRASLERFGGVWSEVWRKNSFTISEFGRLEGLERFNVWGVYKKTSSRARVHAKGVFYIYIYIQISKLYVYIYKKDGNLCCLAVWRVDVQTAPTISKHRKGGKSMNNLTDAETEVLALIAEESAEVIHIVGKILRHGLSSHHPVTNEYNDDALNREIGNLLYVIGIAVAYNLVNEVDINYAILEKAKSIEPYLHEVKPVPPISVALDRKPWETADVSR